jgi:cold shock CspA family protein
LKCLEGFVLQPKRLEESEVTRPSNGLAGMFSFCLTEDFMQGVVAMFNKIRGYGFVVDEQNYRRRLFFHIGKWQSAEEPVTGMRVYFDEGPGYGDHPRQAIHVCPIQENAAGVAEVKP